MANCIGPRSMSEGGVRVFSIVRHARNEQDEQDEQAADVGLARRHTALTVAPTNKMLLQLQAAVGYFNEQILHTSDGPCIGPGRYAAGGV